MRCSWPMRPSYRATTADLKVGTTRGGADVCGVMVFVVPTFRSACAHTSTDVRTTRIAVRDLPNLRIDFVKIRFVHEHFSRFAALTRRHQAVHFHHVDEPRGPAEADTQAPLQVGDRRLAARYDDA